MVMERFVTVDEFSSGWNPVRRCAHNRKILRQRESHVAELRWGGAAIGGSRRAPYKGTNMPGRKKTVRLGAMCPYSIHKNHSYLFNQVSLML